MREHPIDRMLRQTRELRDWYEELVHMACPAGHPPTIFANAMLQAAGRTMLRHLGSRDRVAGWLQLEAMSVGNPDPEGRYPYGMADETPELMELFGDAVPEIP